MTVKILLHLGPDGELGYKEKTVYNGRYRSLDFQLFKLLTTSGFNSILVAGRKTAESMSSVPELGRKFYYVSKSRIDHIGKYRQWEYISEFALESLMYDSDIEPDIFLIGGASMLSNWHYYADKYLIFTDTNFDYKNTPCDTYWKLPDDLRKRKILFKYDSLECSVWS